MKLDTGGPARGTQVTETHYSGVAITYWTEGTTWLDECAMRCLNRVSACCDTEQEYNKEIAKKAYALAREMLAEKRRLEGGGE